MITDKNIVIIWKIYNCFYLFSVWLVTFAFSLFSMNSLYRKDQCQSPDPTAPSFAPSFAAVAAGVDRNMGKDIHCKYIVEKQSLKACVHYVLALMESCRVLPQTWQVSFCPKRHGQLHPSHSPMSSDTTPPNLCPTYLSHPPLLRTMGKCPLFILKMNPTAMNDKFSTKEQTDKKWQAVKESWRLK